MNNILLKTFLFLLLAELTAAGISHAQQRRTVLSLNGTWQIAEGNTSHPPAQFTHTVSVPGLVTMAKPGFQSVAPAVKDRRSLSQVDSLRQAFWYRRSFTLKGPVPAVALLKIAKAKYGTRVMLNGHRIGSHFPCFTPGYFDVKKALQPGKNELLISVGASRDAVPDSIPDGLDFEKERYIPGIYDQVSLQLSGAPHIARVQTVPDVAKKQLQVQLSLDHFSGAKTTMLVFTIRETVSGKTAGQFKKEVQLPVKKEETTVNVRIPITDCHLWSPDDPFRYTLAITTAGDQTETTFGMRNFHFDPVTHQAILNGAPYAMRGSNITLYRFFEDSACQGLPWDTAWVRRLFKSFKQFHWNSLRFCIGLPPEQWYRIADEEGFLIQDEFPIWYGGIGWNKWPTALKADELSREYTEWMQENWNHPSVVIWDASNETVCNNGQTDETGEAVWRVRNLDLSNRPWDNSYSPHRAPGDVYESHPYHFQHADFKLKDLTNAPIPPGNQYPNKGDFPVLINEYGWLWLNRDGSPTTLTRNIYHNLLGSEATIQQRRHLYATYMAAETEYWRCRSEAAGVLIFTALGYSRADGQTSDFFLDPAELVYDPAMLRYLPDAFSPVGLMLDEWGDSIACNTGHTFKVVAINDRPTTWQGTVRIQILDGKGNVHNRQSQPLTLPPHGRREIALPCTTPRKAGFYTLIASLVKAGNTPIRSIRENIPFQ